MQLQVVASRKLYVQIADQIRGLVAAGTLKPGDQLPPERELSEQLGVSRPTVREALIALEVAGIIELRMGVGAFVRHEPAAAASVPANNHSPLEIIDARMLIEPHVAGLAAEGATPEAIGRLNRIVAAMRADTEQGRWSEAADEQLHLTIAGQCGNQTMRELLASLWMARSEGLDTRLHQHLASLDALRWKILADHTAIVAAVERHDPPAARAAMAQHLDYVRQAMLQAWD
ncbi:MAG: hypothetical protein BGO82_11745 [Devosia sp. 67-54]|uniref:FadR/GntR family transcriptional regulator n=1 Tax=unclassified Devosia TaxID=196773 RepID=UPI00095E85B6|nr:MULTISPECIES: FadR/GntR family transcriptional regulator [unclassified Devosia]MBN9304685.1 FadR family transcriptional regulator [Devosia sp.]OJX15336.1 MAG: hypothetical protein BGO82_11745 [Devosia sp. 67-54]